MIAELQDERRRLDEAIEALERLSVGSRDRRRRGRPARVIRQADQLSQANDKILSVHFPREKKADYPNS